MIAPHRRPVASAKARQRRGTLTLEVMMVLPILLLATFAVFQFGSAMIVRQAATHAATVAAREAAKGADADELVHIVNAVLHKNHNLPVGEHVSLVFEDPAATPPVVRRGRLPCDPPRTPELDADEVRITVCLDLAARPIINALAAYGIDFSGKTCHASSVATKED